MLWQWIPWKYIIRHVAKAHDVVDPLTLLARIRSFSQPSEVKEPMELVRANIIFQARGFVNARAIQFNLDWVWPHWVERQFNPRDHSFIPRGYALSHVNCTQRNWTAVGQPGLPVYPLVDPRGLVTPRYDGWSLDFWLRGPDGRWLLPSKLDGAKVTQRQAFEDGLACRTVAEDDTMRLESRVALDLDDGEPVCRVRLRATGQEGGHLAVSLRPYNPEGVHFIEDLAYEAGTPGWRVGDEGRVRFDRAPERALASDYGHGDVIMRADGRGIPADAHCRIGMASALALFPLDNAGEAELNLEVPLAEDLSKNFHGFTPRDESWEGVMAEAARMEVPDPELAYLFDASARSLVLLSAHEVYPGPYTYRRFWFRDAAFMCQALLCANLPERVTRQFEGFLSRQKRDGYFESQEGEWDANGQVLWLLEQWSRRTGEPLPPDMVTAARKAADWIIRKRITDQPGKPYNGLLPSGFSAEHLGPNDYYYWDDYWGLAGLRAASRLFAASGDGQEAQRLGREADAFEAAIWATVEAIDPARAKGGVPASPNRRMDAGAIGSMVADYPLQLTPPGDPRLLATLEHLMAHSSLDMGFFQDMVHSGVNAYLSFDLAQTMLRSGDARHREVIRSLAGMASQAGHWPEAVHPFSGGGCMGDGQHGWAAAEWFMLMRNLFVFEEGDRVILGLGLFPEWLEARERLFFGPTLTRHGKLSVAFTPQADTLRLDLEAGWCAGPPAVTVRAPGYRPLDLQKGQTQAVLERDGAGG